MDVKFSETNYCWVVHELTEAQLKKLHDAGLTLSEIGLDLGEQWDTELRGYDEVTLEIDSDEASTSIVLKPKKSSAEMHDHRGKNLIFVSICDEDDGWSGNTERDELQKGDIEYKTIGLRLPGGRTEYLIRQIEIPDGELEPQDSSGGWNDYELFEADGSHYRLNADVLDDDDVKLTIA